MKHIVTALLLILAVLAGLVLPGVWLDYQDKTMDVAQTVELTEPTLEWGGNEESLQQITEITGAELARRVRLFASGTFMLFPFERASDEEMQWVGGCAAEFLHMLFEVPPEIQNLEAEYQIAWFEDGTTVPVWTVTVLFNRSWSGIITMDGECGAILQCAIQPNGSAFDELFPESCHRAVEDPKTALQDLVLQRFCDTLGSFMGGNQGAGKTIWLTTGPDSVYFNFEDAPTASVMARLYVDSIGGVWFNHP